MKRNLKMYTIPSCLALFTLVLIGCNKDVIPGSSSNFISVEEKNSSLYFHYSATDNPSSGNVGYDSFALDLGLYDSTEVMATITLGDIGGANNDTIFTSHQEKYGFWGIPYFQRNLDSVDMATAMALHSANPVVGNANYELEFQVDKILIHTTTQFFQPDPTATYYLTPYVIVDSIIANQAGHPDLGSTAHRKVVVDVGRLSGFEPQYHGYKVASTNIDNGYRLNLTFEVDRLPSWTNEDQISVALVLTTRDAADRPVFVNANTQH